MQTNTTQTNTLTCEVEDHTDSLSLN